MTPLTEKDLATVLRRSVPDRDPAPDLASRARERATRMRTRHRGLVAMAVAAVVVGVGVPALSTGLSGGPGSGPGDGLGHAPPAGPAAAASACPGEGCEAAVVAAIRQPLRLPTVPPGADCPVSPSRRFPAGAGFSQPFGAVGPGPLYVAAESPDIVLSDDGGSWLEQKVIWVVGKGYAGALLLRGGRIDGDGQLRFTHYLGAVGYVGDAGDGKRHPELAYLRGGLTSEPDNSFSSYPSGIYVTSPGCYAIQVDGVGFSRTLVFRALAP